MARRVTPEIRSLTLPRRGLSREEAALYIGVGTTKFDEMIADGRMPQPKQIDGRKVWDIRALDAAFDALPSAAERNPWDDVTDVLSPSGR